MVVVAAVTWHHSVVPPRFSLNGTPNRRASVLSARKSLCEISGFLVVAQKWTGDIYPTSVWCVRTLTYYPVAGGCTRMEESFWLKFVRPYRTMR